MLREFRQLQSMVGRRDAFKYGGLGLVAVALSACGGKSDSGGAPPADKPPKATVAGAAVEAFARGAWRLFITPKGQVNDEYTLIEISGRTWKLDRGDEAGSFTLSGDALQVLWDGRSSDNVWAATGMPGAVGNSAALTLQWGHHATSGPGDPGSPVDTTPFPLLVTWDGTTLKIQAKNGVVISAVRV